MLSDPQMKKPRFSVERGGYTIEHKWKYNDYRSEGDVTHLVLRRPNGEQVREVRIDTAELPRGLRAAHWILHDSGTARLRYAAGKLRGLGKNAARSAFLHRFIMRPEKGMEVDHIDGDGLNCLRSNMRIIPHGENARNKPYHRRLTQLECTVPMLLACQHPRWECECKIAARDVLEGTPRDHYIRLAMFLSSSP